jgi:hypothetical protein
MDQRSYTTTVAAALRQMMDEIAELHLPPGRTLHGPDAEDTARWLRAHLDEIGLRLGSRLAGVEPPPDLEQFHERLLTQWAQADDVNMMTHAEVAEWNAQLLALCQAAGVEFPLGDEPEGPEAEEVARVVDHLSQLVYGEDDNAWEQKVRAALEELTPEEQDQVVEYLRELRQGSR